MFVWGDTENVDLKPRKLQERNVNVNFETKIIENLENEQKKKVK